MPTDETGELQTPKNVIERPSTLEIISEAKKLAEEMIKEERETLRKQAEDYKAKIDTLVEDKAIVKATELAELDKKTTMDMKIFNDQKTQLEWLWNQKALPKDETPWQTLMKLRIWKSMGMTEYESINWLAFVSWRMTVYGEAMVWLIVKAWYTLDFLETTETKCTVKISKWDREMTETFTIEEANKAGWTKKGFVWNNQPKLMLRYKAIRQVAKFFCPHVLWGIITAEEAEVEFDPIKTQKTSKKEEIQDAEVESTEDTQWEIEQIVFDIEKCEDIKELKKLSTKVKELKNDDAFKAYVEKMNYLNNKE